MPPRKKKHPRLPNAFGSIRYLGKGRTKPYAVHPPAEDCDNHGNYIRPKALCYVDDWYVGFAVLTSYHAGTYTPGDEVQLKTYKSLSDDVGLDAFCQKLLADHALINGTKEAPDKTFAEVYEDFFEWKYVKNAERKYSESSKNTTRAAYKHCTTLYQRSFRSLRHNDLQKVINDCQRKSATKELIVNLFKQMYIYADIYELCDKDYSAHISKNCENDDEHGIPFTDHDLGILWKNKSDPTVEMILIMCYSGFRITEYEVIEVNMVSWYFHGGIKTDNSKKRYVPIHSAIKNLVENRMNHYGKLMDITGDAFRKTMYEVLDRLGIEKHTPHDCRHTFSALCETYDVREVDRRRMLGHSIKDITNKVYGHRTIEELREQIEKIKLPTST